MDGMDERVQIRRRLGRGLNALLGDDVAVTDMPVSTGGGEPTAPQGELRQMPVNSIERNPYQPRTEFEASSLRELSDSIQQHGVLQPLLVRALPNGGWQLIAGERRLMAAKQAGLATVPCRILELEEQQVCEVALEENLKRKDLNVLEKAQAFANYLQQFGRTIEELSKQLSLDRSTVSNLLRLLDLAEPVKQSLRSDKITGGHARRCCRCPPSNRSCCAKRSSRSRCPSERQKPPCVNCSPNRNPTPRQLPSTHNTSRSPPPLTTSCLCKDNYAICWASPSRSSCAAKSRDRS